MFFFALLRVIISQRHTEVFHTCAEPVEVECHRERFIWWRERKREKNKRAHY
jgi:hypothetical protein